MITKRVKALPFLILFLTLASCRSSASFNFGAYSEAEKLYEKGKYDKAIVKYEEYLHENPEGNMAIISSYYLAKSYQNLGEIEKARGIYEKIIKEHPGMVWADFSKTQLEELKALSSERRSP